MIRRRALACLSMRGRYGRRQSKQEFLRRCRDVRRCTRMGLSPARRFTAKPGRPILMSSAGALAHVPSACIGVHLRASALNPCLLTPPRAAPSGEVARARPASQNQLHRETQAETAGLTHPEALARRRHPMPSVTASPVSSKLLASAMPRAAKSPCTNSAPRDDGGSAPARRGYDQSSSAQHRPPRRESCQSADGMAKQLRQATRRAHVPGGCLTLQAAS